MFRLCVLVGSLFFAGGAVGEAAGLPALDARVSAHVLAIYRHGLAEGNHPDVFAKVGDSNTATDAFLRGIGCNKVSLGSHGSLAATVRFFSREDLPAGYTPWIFAKPTVCPNNSFVRIGFAAHPGWGVANLLAPFTASAVTKFDGRIYWGRRSFSGGQVVSLEGRPWGNCAGAFKASLNCELHVLHPSLAFLMIGTNDLVGTAPAIFAARLKRVVTQTIAVGTIPVLSTIPPCCDHRVGVGRFNAVIAKLAGTEHVPLWNLWSALNGTSMIDHGRYSDQVHLSVYKNDPSDLTHEALRYGMNLRNLQALDILDAIRLRIFKSGSRR